MQKPLNHGNLCCVAVIAFLCVVGPPLAADNILPGVDLFHTTGGSTMDSTFYHEPTAADFFFPGSDPFDQVINLNGSPLTTSEDLGPTDVIVERLDEAVFEDECNGYASISIIVRALSLEGQAFVHNSGTGEDVPYTIHVCLSQVVPQSMGYMSLWHDCPQGGRFASSLPIETRLTFAPEWSGYETIVIDPIPETIVMEVLPPNEGYWSHDAGLSTMSVYNSVGGSVDHDCDPATADVDYPPSSNFVAGLRPYPCVCTGTKGRGPTDGIHSQPTLTSHEARYAAHGVYPPVTDPSTAGACCLPDGSSAWVQGWACDDLGGYYAGDGSFPLGDLNDNGVDDICESVGVPPGGACCDAHGTCFPNLTSVLCDHMFEAIPTYYHGDGVDCLGDGDGDGIDDLCAFTPTWPSGLDNLVWTESFVRLSPPYEPDEPILTLEGLVPLTIIERHPVVLPNQYMSITMTAFSFGGFSDLFGEYEVLLDPAIPSTGRIWPMDDSGDTANAYLDVSYMITTELGPGMDTLRGTSRLDLVFLPYLRQDSGWVPMPDPDGPFLPPYGGIFMNREKDTLFDTFGEPAYLVDLYHRLTPPPDTPKVRIQKTHNTYQGLHEFVSVTLEEVPAAYGGFDLLIAYDASALALQTIVPGSPFYDPAPDGCGWEYFTYRMTAHCTPCPGGCPSGMVKVLGLAETNNGSNHPDCFVPSSLPAEIFKLDFLVSNDRTLECQYVPIRFFWCDCGDNTFSSIMGDTLFISDHVYEFDGTDITDPTYGFPTYFGAQDWCLNPDPSKPTAVQLVDFINGGIDIICADSIDLRGDINLNGTPYEIADAVMFACYFVYGDACWYLAPYGHVAASDVNADGITLSVADFVYLIRVITGDAEPIPKITPTMADADLVNGVLSVGGEMGAAHVVVDRDVTPVLLAESMEMKYSYDAEHDLTRILVYSMEKGHTFSGDFLGGIDGHVTTLEMAAYDGAPVTAKLVPKEFALYPCYPNPFNPVTTISFALASPVDYELVIYNALGQTVETFRGHSGPGLERIDWNATGYSSGVYFYRLTAGDFTDTRKMVLLK